MVEIFQILKAKEITNDHSDMEKWLKNISPRKGDLIRVRRKAGYFHFGIALSDKEVIHYSGLLGDDVSNPENIKIRYASIETFVRDDVLEVLSEWLSPFNAEEVVNRAKNYVESAYFRGKTYNFVTNNCEHFARYCYYGEAESRQVLDTITGVAIATGVAVSAATVKIVKTIKDKNKSNSEH